MNTQRSNIQLGDTHPEVVQPQRTIEALAFVASDTPEAVAACDALHTQYDGVDPHDADVIVALGGDGLMLQTLHQFMNTRKPIYGMNRGSVGFLMNEYREDDLLQRIRKAEATAIHPLLMRVTDVDGNQQIARRHQRSLDCCAQTRSGNAKMRGHVSMSVYGWKSLSATAFSWRRQPAAPPTTSPHTDQSCRSTRHCWR